MHAFKAVMLFCALAAPIGAGAQVNSVKPFSGRYQVQWHGITVGYSDLQLTQDPKTGFYDYLSRSNARGIFRIAFSDEITQKSVIAIRDGHAQPLSYRGDDGTPSTAKDVSLDFDWTNMRLKGVSEDKPVDLPLKPDTQDPMSVQIEIMLDLINDRAIHSYWVADKDEIKDFIYTNEGKAKIKTELGDIETVVLAGKRPGGNRVTRLWFAPSLGYVPVQAQRTRDGKVEFSMHIRTLKH